LLCISILSYFFFQAEDGIRDFHVTGVQTCALPIYFCRVLLEHRISAARFAFVEQRLMLTYLGEQGGQASQAFQLAHLGKQLGVRSEERRVGKERRDRWSVEYCRK